MSAQIDERLDAIDAKLDTVLRLLRTEAHDNRCPPRCTTLASDDEASDEGSDDERPPEPDCDPVPSLPATTLSRMSRDAMERGDVDEALDLANRALTANPDSVSALRARGKVLMEKQQWEGARADFAQAQQIDFDADTELLLKDACAHVSTTPKPPASTPVPNITPKPPASTPVPNILPTIPSDVDLESMIRNPAVMGSVADVLRNPEAMKAIQDSPLFQSMLSKGMPPQ